MGVNAMNIENNCSGKGMVSVEALTKGLSITLTRPECTDSQNGLGYNDTTGSGPKSA
jgi:hypothetical protein